MKDDLHYVGHIHDCIERIEQYITKGREDFFGNTLVQDAVMRNFGIIGEAAKKMSEERKCSHPEIPWKKITGVRDIVIHDYAGIDWNTIWNIIENDLPTLKSVISDMLRELQNQRKP